MRPTGLESIRAVQSALAEVLAPELTSPFAQDAAQTLQMLLESFAAEWDGAADRLCRDNEELVRLLNVSRDVIKGIAHRNEDFACAVNEIERRLDEPHEASLSLSLLAARNNALRETIEHLLTAFENTVGQGEFATIEPVRRDIYAHLRQVATRGWSFWDVSSFRGKMAAIRSTEAGDDGPHARAVE